MGRYSTGAQTVNAIQRLEISKLKAMGYFEFFKRGHGSHTKRMSWSDGSVVGIETHHTQDGSYLILNYNVIDHRTGAKTEMYYKVQIEFKPSNLGKGSVLYFLCPVSKKRCRILYRAYGSHYFKAREAYINRIYYEAQKNSKQYRLLDRFNTVRYKVESICESKKRNQATFRGKPTKQRLKFESLIEKYERLDELSENFIMAKIYRK